MSILIFRWVYMDCLQTVWKEQVEAKIIQFMTVLAPFQENHIWHLKITCIVSTTWLRNSTSGYVKAIGMLKVYRDRVSLSIHTILPVVHFDEITEHFLSAISCYLYYKKKSTGMTSTSMLGSTAETAVADRGASGYGMDMSDTESKVPEWNSCYIDL